MTIRPSNETLELLDISSALTALLSPPSNSRSSYSSPNNSPITRFGLALQSIDVAQGLGIVDFGCEAEVAVAASTTSSSSESSSSSSTSSSTISSPSFACPKSVGAGGGMPAPETSSPSTPSSTSFPLDTWQLVLIAVGFVLLIIIPLLLIYRKHNSKKQGTTKDNGTTMKDSQTSMRTPEGPTKGIRGTNNNEDMPVLPTHQPDKSTIADPAHIQSADDDTQHSVAVLGVKDDDTHENSINTDASVDKKNNSELTHTTSDAIVIHRLNEGGEGGVDQEVKTSPAPVSIALSASATSGSRKQSVKGEPFSNPHSDNATSRQVTDGLGLAGCSPPTPHSHSQGEEGKQISDSAVRGGEDSKGKGEEVGPTKEKESQRNISPMFDYVSRTSLYRAVENTYRPEVEDSVSDEVVYIDTGEGDGEGEGEGKGRGMQLYEEPDTQNVIYIMDGKVYVKKVIGGNIVYVRASSTAFDHNYRVDLAALGLFNRYAPSPKEEDEEEEEDAGDEAEEEQSKEEGQQEEVAMGRHPGQHVEEGVEPDEAKDNHQNLQPQVENPVEATTLGGAIPSSAPSTDMAPSVSPASPTSSSSQPSSPSNRAVTIHLAPTSQ